jgi:hypothetical protein
MSNGTPDVRTSGKKGTKPQPVERSKKDRKTVVQREPDKQKARNPKTRKTNSDPKAQRTRGGQPRTRDGEEHEVVVR